MTNKRKHTGFLARKALHLAVVVAFAAGAIVWGRWPTLPIAGAVLALLLGGEWLRTRSPVFQSTLLRILGPLMTPEERHKSSRIRLNGATWAMVAVVVALIAFPMPVATATLLILAVGDPVAALVGRNYGRLRLGDKTVEGTIAFFALSLLTVLAFTPLTFAVAAVGCAVAAVVELLPLSWYDNVPIAIAAGAAMMGMMWAL